MALVPTTVLLVFLLLAVSVPCMTQYWSGYGTGPLSSVPPELTNDLSALSDEQLDLVAAKNAARLALRYYERARPLRRTGLHQPSVSPYKYMRPNFVTSFRRARHVPHYPYY